MRLAVQGSMRRNGNFASAGCVRMKSAVVALSSKSRSALKGLSVKKRVQNFVLK